jgi:hypothetical protein
MHSLGASKTSNNCYCLCETSITSSPFTIQTHPLLRSKRGILGCEKAHQAIRAKDFANELFKGRSVCRCQRVTTLSRTVCRCRLGRFDCRCHCVFQNTPEPIELSLPLLRESCNHSSNKRNTTECGTAGNSLRPSDRVKQKGNFAGPRPIVSTNKRNLIECGTAGNS